MRPTLSMIVEGDSEKESLPLLVRRIANASFPGVVIEIATPWRVPRGRLVREGFLEQQIRASARQAGVGGAILLVIDADDDCPKHFAPALRGRVEKMENITCPVSIVLAEREWESWFMAAAASLRGQRGLDPNLDRPASVEAIRDAKGWIDKHKQRGYSPILDQPALTSLMDIELARSSNSFDKCYREIERLCLHFQKNIV